MNQYCTKCHNVFDVKIMTIINDDFYVCPTCYEKIQNSNPHEYTEDEIKEKLIKHFWFLLEYWEDLPDKTTHERMSGMLHSLLASLDGSSMEVPGFKIIPIGSKENTEFHKKFGENWYPEEDIDIGGGLHEIMYNYGPTIKNFRRRKLNKVKKNNEN